MGPRSTSRSTDPAEGSTAQTPDDADQVVVGVVRGPHGVRGEVKVDPRTDVPERFSKGARLRARRRGPPRQGPRSGGARNAPIVRFAGYATRTAAEQLRGRHLSVSRSEARRAAKGGYLWADLLGLRAESPSGAALGTVREVLRAGETDVLVVRADGARADLLLPAIASVVRAVDLAGGRIVVVPQEILE